MQDERKSARNTLLSEYVNLRENNENYLLESEVNLYNAVTRFANSYMCTYINLVKNIVACKWITIDLLFQLFRSQSYTLNDRMISKKYENSDRT